MLAFVYFMESSAFTETLSVSLDFVDRNDLYISICFMLSFVSFSVVP